MPESPTWTVSADAIKRLADLVEKNGLSELRYEEDDLRITLRTSAYRPAVVTTVAPTTLSPTLSSLPELNDTEPGEYATEMQEDTSDMQEQVRIEAPLMGVFYRSAKPEDPPFVDIGDTVEVGQVIGLIEAMKVFSEVESEVAGVVQSIPAKNGGLVHPGDALVVLAQD